MSAFSRQPITAPGATRGLYAGDYACRNCGFAFETAVPAPGAVVNSPAAAMGPATPWLAPQHTAALQVRMVSGQAYTVQEILLFDQISLATAENLKAQAMQKFGGFQTGIGAIGSLKHVVTTSLVVGALEGVVSASMQKDGMRMLENAERLALESRGYCYFFRPHQIFSVELPIPEMWQATLPVSQAESRLFIHNGDPAVVARLSDGKIIALMWDKVESYEQSAFV